MSSSVSPALTYIDHKRGLVKLPICSVVTEDDGEVHSVPIGKNSWFTVKVFMVERNVI